MHDVLLVNGNVSHVRILDVEGRVVRELGSPRGHTLTWDGTDNTGRQTGPGVYVIEMRSGSRVERRTVAKL